MEYLLIVNDVIMFSNGIAERILWIDRFYKYCYTIRLQTEKIIIQIREISELVESLTSNDISLSEDNFSNLVPLEKLSPIEVETMEKAYEIVSFIANTENEPEVFERKIRRKYIEEAKMKFSVGDKAVYKYLRKYWQGGKIKTSLVPLYSNCGGKGVKRNNFSEKPGRPSSEYYVTGENRGLVVNESIRNIFEIAYKRYYRTPTERSLPRTFELMLKDFFSVVRDGERAALPAEQRPTFRQFSYWYYNSRDPVEDIKQRRGKKVHDLKFRRLLSSIDTQAFGPGYRYYIDATIADVYLVNRISRDSVIGRPVVYILKDEFSRLVTGLHVALEGPSWNGAASAIQNCYEDKVEFCKKFSINIDQSEWPARGLPQILLADRGELVGPIGEKLVSYISLQIENAPTGRGDAKSIVEQQFRIINTKIKHWLPAAVKKEFRERGERDYRLDATLDIEEFTRIIILFVIEYNANILNNYPMKQEMINEGVRPIPNELWEWGIRNITGSLRRVPEDLLKVSLMRSARASITEGGIKFNGLYYDNKSADLNNWYELARIQGISSIDIYYDNRDITNIYLTNPESKTIEVCTLNEKSGLFRGKSLDEVKDYRFYNNVMKNGLSDYQHNLKLNFNVEVENIIKNAKSKKSASDKSNKQKISEIKSNRKEENRDIRLSQAISLIDKSDSDTDMENQNISINDTVEYSSRSSILERMKKLKGKGEPSEE
jgi:hypothetical protein